MLRDRLMPFCREASGPSELAVMPHVGLITGGRLTPSSGELDPSEASKGPEPLPMWSAVHHHPSITGGQGLDLGVELCEVRTQPSAGATGRRHPDGGVEVLHA